MTELQQKDRFRPLLVIVTLLAWALFLWMATHRSEQASYFGYSKSYLVLLAAPGRGAMATTLVHWGPVYRWLYARRLNIIVPIVTTVLGLGVLELAIRFIDPAGISYYAYAKRYHLAKLADDEVFYRHPSDWSARYGDVDVTTNAYGFRSAPIADKQADEFRVLFLGDSVTFVGLVQQSAETAEIGKLDVFEALLRQESFGVAVLEAGAAGRPVVVSDADGLVEVVQHGQTGLVVPREDAVGAAEALRGLIENPEQRQALGSAGREQVSTTYGWDQSVSRMLEVYDSALAARRAAQ